MKKLRLALVYGGPSGEHEVSCISAASIFLNLDPDRYDVVPIGVARNGKWYLQEPFDREDVQTLGKLPLVESFSQLLVFHPSVGIFGLEFVVELDIAFSIVHGLYGEDGRYQGIFESVGIPYTGSGVLGSAIGMDKVVAKKLWEFEGLPVVPYVAIGEHEYDATNSERTFGYVQERLGLPLFVKPANSGSSVGVSKVSSAIEFRAAMEGALRIDRKVLIETAIDAREVEVSVMGTYDVRAFGPGEIAPTHEFYDYEAKYVDPNGARLLIPAPLSDRENTEILELAKKAYRTVEARGFARVDFFLDRKTHRIYINEINTLPGFTTISMFPRMAMSTGMTYAQVLDEIVQDALKVRSVQTPEA